MKDQQFIAQKIRSEYVERQTTELDELRSLDKKVKRPAKLFGYVFGSLSAIVMGAGMSLVMTDIGATVGIQNSLVVGIILGVIGLGLSLLTYPIFKRIMKRRKETYSYQIMALTDKLINN